MKDLIEALTIFAKYADKSHAPTHCEHDVLMICAGVPKDIAPDDAKRVKKLGFIWSDDDGDGCWISFRFGSC